MEQGIQLPLNTESLDASAINDLFDAGTQYLKTRAAYVFENRRMNHETWTISTWAKHVKRSHILKYGTKQDKANLPQRRVSIAHILVANVEFSKKKQLVLQEEQELSNKQ